MFSNAHIVTFVWTKYHKVFIKPFFYCPEVVYQNGFYKFEIFTCIIQTIIVKLLPLASRYDPGNIFTYFSPAIGMCPTTLSS